MRRLGFVYKKPRSLPAQADEAKQAAFIARYEALMTGLGRMRWLSFPLLRQVNMSCQARDAVHPEYQSRPVHDWFHKDQKPP